ncbi:MAG: hypothetical protein HY899_20060 [Deltaproteobacteria bacterium]|nr:hypothetical protein [Deltaproteobacteria bacterium]
MGSREQRTTRQRSGLDGWRAQRVTARGVVVAACVALLSIGVGVLAVRAGSCRVLVALGSMRIEPTTSGLTMRLTGTWEFDNLLQVATGLSFNVLVVQGDHFVRFTYPDQAHSGYYTGLSQLLDSGLQGSDLQAIETAGGTDPNARFISFEPQRMKLALPQPNDVGPYSAVAYLVIDADYISPIISNTLSLSIKNSTAATPVNPGAVVQPAATSPGAAPEVGR